MAEISFMLESWLVIVGCPLGRGYLRRHAGLGDVIQVRWRSLDPLQNGISFTIVVINLSNGNEII